MSKIHMLHETQGTDDMTGVSFVLQVFLSGQVFGLLLYPFPKVETACILVHSCYINLGI